MQKAGFAARHGELSEAIDVLWCAMGLGKAVDEHREKAAGLAREWLCGVGLEGTAAL